MGCDDSGLYPCVSFCLPWLFLDAWAEMILLRLPFFSWPETGGKNFQGSLAKHQAAAFFLGGPQSICIDCFCWSVSQLLAEAFGSTVHLQVLR